MKQVCEIVLHVAACMQRCEEDRVPPTCPLLSSPVVVPVVFNIVLVVVNVVIIVNVVVVVLFLVVVQCTKCQVPSWHSWTRPS